MVRSPWRSIICLFVIFRSGAARALIIGVAELSQDRDFLVLRDALGAAQTPPTASVDLRSRRSRTGPSRCEWGVLPQTDSRPAPEIRAVQYLNGQGCVFLGRYRFI